MQITSIGQNIKFGAGEYTPTFEDRQLYGVTYPEYLKQQIGSKDTFTKKCDEKTSQEMMSGRSMDVSKLQKGFAKKVYDALMKQIEDLGNSEQMEETAEAAESEYVKEIHELSDKIRSVKLDLRILENKYMKITDNHENELSKRFNHGMCKHVSSIIGQHKRATGETIPLLDVNYYL